MVNYPLVEYAWVKTGCPLIMFLFYILNIWL